MLKDEVRPHLLLSPVASQTDNEITFKVSFLQQKLALSLGADCINCLPVKQADKYEHLSEFFVLVLPSAKILKIYRQPYQITRDVKSRVH